MSYALNKNLPDDANFGMKFDKISARFSKNILQAAQNELKTT